ncbi:hypothetical protein FS749_013717 [Ceratobasidium sp. UAMH 11750]|nr:hypothetical protein FS749_013717 [Ceratobasidium sp. UAMH 11750]
MPSLKTSRTERALTRLKRLLLCVSNDPQPTSPIQQAAPPAMPLINSQPTSELLQTFSALPSMAVLDPEAYKNSYPPAMTVLPALSLTENPPKSEGWAELRTFSSLLNKGATVFGPLKQAVDGILTCVETFETVADNREDYRKLRSELSILFHDFAGYFGASTPPAMTSSIINLAQGIERELALIRQKHQRHQIGRYLKARQDADDLLESYRRIQGLLGRLTLNANINIWKAVDEQAVESRLKHLPSSPAAKYSSAESANLRRGGCTKDTRVQVLKQLHDWACDSESPKIYWLNGMAGTGKTTIAYSLCEQLENDQKLAGSFFCSRQLPECRNVNRIVPSISYQLARFSRPFQYTLSRVLEKDPDVYNQPLPEQFKQLIFGPLREIQDMLPTDLIVVIDALDECDDDEGIARVLDILLSYARDLPVRFFVTSRPDAKILDRMRSHEGGHIPGELRLHELERSIVQEDIKTYLVAELGPRMNLSAADLNTLVERSGVLFIYAATVVRYIGGDNFSRGPKRLIEVLNASSGSSNDSSKGVDTLYTTILEAAFTDADLTGSDRAEMRVILDTIVCAQEPLSVDVVAGLLRLDDKTSVEAALRPLLSVLQVSDTTRTITTLHQSFPDYLLEKRRSDRFHCNASEHNARLVELCFDQIKTPNPPFNICNLDSSYVFDEDVHDLPARVKKAISKELFYACRYWGAHLVSAKSSQDLAGMVFGFLSERLLLWMEVMNLKRCIYDGTRMLYQVQRWSEKANGLEDNMKQLLRDAWMFITSFSSSPVTLSTPHIYVSTLSFWPDDRPISKYYRRQQPRLVNGASTAMSIQRATPLAIMDTKQPVRCLAYSPGGAYIVSGFLDGTIRTWDARAGQAMEQVLEGHTNAVNCLAYSPDGAYLASGSMDRTIRIWDTRTGQQVGRPLEGHTRQVVSITYSPDGAYVASGSEDCTIRIWDSRTGHMIGQPLQGHTHLVISVAFSPDGAYLASGSGDQTMRIWDVRTGKTVVQPAELHTGWVKTVAYSPNGANIVTGSCDGTMRLWDARTGQPIGQAMKDHAWYVKWVAYSPDGAYIVSGSADYTVRIRDAHNGQPIGQPLEGHTNIVTSVAYSPDGAYIVSGSDDKTLRIWDARTCMATGRRPIAGHTNAVTSVAYSANGAWVASGSGDNVHIWNARTGRAIGKPLQGHTSAVNSVAFSPDSAYVASGSWDKTIRIWNARTGQAVGKPLQHHSDVVYSVAYSPNGAYIASGSDDGTVCIWNIQSGRVVGQAQDGHTRGVTSIAYSPDGAYVASGSWDETIIIWDARTGQTVGQPLEIRTSTPISVAYSPDSAYIVSGCHDHTIRIWNAKTGQMVEKPLEGHTGAVNSVAYSPDCAYIVSGSDDHTIRIWDARTGQPIGQPLEGHLNEVKSVAYSPNGEFIISGSRDATIRFWDARSGASIHSAPGEKAQIISPLHAVSNAQHPEPHICNPGCQFNAPHTSWTMNDDGWVVTDDRKLLVWIPLDLQHALLRPQNTAVISRHGFLRLHFDHKRIGDHWQKHFQPGRSPGL